MIVRAGIEIDTSTPSAHVSFVAALQVARAETNDLQSRMREARLAVFRANRDPNARRDDIGQFMEREGRDEADHAGLDRLGVDRQIVVCADGCVWQLAQSAAEPNRLTRSI